MPSTNAGDATGARSRLQMSDEQFANILERIRKENKLEDEQAFQNASSRKG